MGYYTYDSSTGQEKFVAGDYYYNMIAEEETSPTTSAHSKGEHLIYNGQLYEVTSSNGINANTALVVYPTTGYNIKVAEKVEEQIEATNSQIAGVKTSLANEAVTRSKVGAHNLIPMSLAYIKEKSDDGTWVGNKYTWNNVEFTVNTDSDGNVISVNVNTSGASANATMVLAKKVFGNTALSTYANPTDGEYIISGGENVTTENSDIQILYYTSGQITLRIASGAVISNKLVYPMLRLVTDPSTEFTPYAMTNAELTAKMEKLNLKDVSSSFTATSNVQTTLGKHIYVMGGLVYVYVAFRPKALNNLSNVSFFTYTEDLKPSFSADMMGMYYKGSLTQPSKKTPFQVECSVNYSTVGLRTWGSTAYSDMVPTTTDDVLIISGMYPL